MEYLDKQQQQKNNVLRLSGLCTDCNPFKLICYCSLQEKQVINSHSKLDILKMLSYLLIKIT